MTESEILELLQYGEHLHLECKKAESKIPRSVWETYSSFANTDGGVILLGVEEHLSETDCNQRFSFIPVPHPEQKIKDFWDTLKGTSKNYVFRGGGVGRSPTHSPYAFRRKAKGEVFRGALNSNHVSNNILMDEDVGICEKGAHIIWIRVPPADYQYRPVYLDGNPIKGSYKRNHEGDYHCSEEEVKAMLRDANDSGNDGGLLQGYTMEDIDLHALRSY
ncbi:MAG: ATP-binding protein [Oscillospiraceae bacterium]|nr:ATP-binding protein [Oscillospiraceae bacterium]